MELKTLSQLDLNLLVVLQVLLEESSVSGAAKRLYLTQSAVSKALGRLRDQLDDPLFTRTAQGMVPTPKALAMKDRLPSVLSALQGLITPQVFEPATVRQEIRMAVGEHAGIVLLPPLVEYLQRKSPGIRLKALNRVEHQLDLLASSDLDFAIHMQHQHYPADFISRTLFRSFQGLMVREGHPLVGKSITDLAAQRMKFVRLILPDEKELEFLANIDLSKRNVVEANTVFETSHVASAIEVIRRTDSVLLIPKVLALEKSITAGTTWLQFNPFSEFAINYALVSHMRTDNSPLHRWLADEITQVANQIFQNGI